MSRKWMVLGAMVLMVLALLVGAGAALAQGPAGQTAGAAGYGGFGAGMRWGGSDGSLVSTLANLLGVSPTEIAAQVREGKSLLDIAGEKGVTVDQLVSAVLSARAERLDEAVAAGRITREQADLMLDSVRQNITSRLESGTLAGPCAGGSAAGRQGRFGGRMGGRMGASTGFVDADGDGVCDLYGTRW
ncbi:MAG: hypothetical protein ACP5TV_12960, partial [Anaerolineae bacterium]